MTLFSSSPFALPRRSGMPLHVFLCMISKTTLGGGGLTTRRRVSVPLRAPGGSAGSRRGVCRAGQPTGRRARRLRIQLAVSAVAEHMLAHVSLLLF